MRSGLLSLFLGIAIFSSSYANTAQEPHLFRNEDTRRQLSETIHTYLESGHIQIRHAQSSWNQIPEADRNLILQVVRDPEVQELLNQYFENTRTHNYWYHRFLTEISEYASVDFREPARRAINIWQERRERSAQRRRTHAEAELLARNEMGVTDQQLQQSPNLRRRFQQRLSWYEDETIRNSRPRILESQPLTPRDLAEIKRIFIQETRQFETRYIAGIERWMTERLPHWQGSPYDLQTVLTVLQRGLHQIPSGLRSELRIMYEIRSQLQTLKRNREEGMLHGLPDSLTRNPTLSILRSLAEESIFIVPTRFDRLLDIPQNDPRWGSVPPEVTEIGTLVNFIDRSRYERSNPQYDKYMQSVHPNVQRWANLFAPISDHSSHGSESTILNRSNSLASNTSSAETNSPRLFNVRSYGATVFMGNPLGLTIASQQATDSISEAIDINLLSIGRRWRPAFQVSNLDLNAEPSHWDNGIISIPTPESRSLQTLEVRSISGAVLSQGEDYHLYRDPISHGYFILWSRSGPPPSVRFDARFDWLRNSNEARAPIPAPIFRNLPRNRIQEEVLRLADAGFSRLADLLNERLKNPHDITAEELAQVFSRSAYYSSIPEPAPRSAQEILENTYHRYSHFIEEGSARFQCDGSNQLFALFMGRVLQDSPHLQAYPNLALMFDSSQTYVSVADFHLRTDLRVGSETGLIVDATPSSRDPRPSPENPESASRILAKLRRVVAPEFAETETLPRNPVTSIENQSTRFANQLRNIRSHVNEWVHLIPRHDRSTSPISRLYQIAGELESILSRSSQSPETAWVDLRDRLAQRYPQDSVPHELDAFYSWLNQKLESLERIMHSERRISRMDYLQVSTLQTHFIELNTWVRQSIRHMRSNEESLTSRATQCNKLLSHPYF